MTLGYDPERVRSLTRATIEAIDHLGSIRSHDDDAYFALKTVGATRRHLEEDWMSLLTDIAKSTAMIAWANRHAIDANRFRWADGRGVFTTRPNRFESMSDEDLLRMVYLDGLNHGGGMAWEGPDFDGPFWSVLPELGAELARRAEDPEFAARLVADAHLLPLVAMAVPVADFDLDLVADLATSLLSGPQISSGMTHILYSHALDSVMRTLMDQSPGHALDVLADPPALLTLASWDRLDTSLVHDFVRIGLYDAVMTGRRSMDDGIGVISELVDITNGPLDSGMRPGMARGVADSMFGYVHTIAHGIGGAGEHSPVFATDGHGDAGPVLGTYADMRDLFGAVLRDPQAGVTMGTVLGAYTDETVERLGATLTSTSAADDPIKFGLLLDAAIAEENAEIDIAEAADRARKLRIGKTVGFGLGFGLGLLGIPSAVGSVAKELTSAISPRPKQRPPAPRGRVGSQVHDGMLLSVLADASRDPQRRVEYGLADLTAAEWTVLDHHLEAVDHAADDTARARALLDLGNHIETHLPAVDRLLVDVSTMAGMDTLRFGGAAIDPD